MLTIFGFYTDDPVYTKHALMLQASAHKFGIDILLHKVSNDEWQKIIAYKPVFIADMRRKLDGPILYIDVDALILEDIQPYFLNIQEDIAVHYIDNKRLISGTVFLNDKPIVYSLVNEWEKQQLESPEVWDQIVLQNILDQWIENKDIAVHKLSPSYMFIYDTSAKTYGNNYKTIIEHYQASRDKRWLKKYEGRSSFQQWLMKFPHLRRSTRKVTRRHDQINHRLTDLDINMRITLDDILS